MTQLFLLHAPDGFFSTPVAAVFWIITIAALAISLRKAGDQLDEKAVPLMGVMAAFIFAGQMFNFQIPGGTSGHLLGGLPPAVAAESLMRNPIPGARAADKIDAR